MCLPHLGGGRQQQRKVPAKWAWGEVRQLHMAKVLLLSVTIVCALLLVANMRSVTEHSDRKKAWMVGIGICGYSSILFECVWNLFGMRMDIKRLPAATAHVGALRSATSREDVAAKKNSEPVTELSWFYPLFSFAGALGHMCSFLWYVRAERINDLFFSAR